MQLPPLIRVMSFGYLHDAPPTEAHITIDLRTHFRDPHPDPAMRYLTSTHPRVRAQVMATPGIPELIDAVTTTALTMTSGPRTPDIVVAIGCSGGRHRAPTVAHMITELLEEIDDVDVALEHLHLTRPVVER